MQPRRDVFLFGLILAGIAILAFGLARLFQNMVASYLLPTLVSLAWALKIGLSLLPQAFYWALLLFGFFIAAWHSLSRRKKPNRKMLLVEREQRNVIQTWLDWLYHPEGGQYSRWRLANHLAEFTLQIIAHRENLSASQAREVFYSSRLTMPARVYTYLQAGLEREPAQHRVPHSHHSSQESENALEIDPAEVVAYLEILILSEETPITFFLDEREGKK